MSEQPYYFQIAPRTVISKTFQKQLGEFRFHIHKLSKLVESSKENYSGQFKQNRMKVDNAKLNFFLPNYFAGKNAGAKYTFEISKKTKYSDQKMVGSYVIDANLYVEEFKRTNNNHYAQLWNMGQNYSIEVQILFDQSRYLLEKVLKQYKNPAQTFNKPLEYQNLGLSKNSRSSQMQEKQFDNQDRYKQKRLALLNQYAGAIVGSGGYQKIFDMQEQEKINKKKQRQEREALEKRQVQNYLLKKPVKPKNETVQNKSSSINKKQQSQGPRIKRTQSTLIQGQNLQSEIKTQKYLILGIILLIILGAGYFLSKLFLKEQTTNLVDSQGQLAKPSKQKVNKKKAKQVKKPMKGKNTQQL